MLAQVDDLLDYVGMSDRRAVQRRTRSVLEAFNALVFVSPLPPIEDVAADAVVTARGSDVPADLFSVLQNGQAPVRPSDQILLTPNTVSHAAPSIRSPDCQQPQSVLDLGRQLGDDRGRKQFKRVVGCAVMSEQHHLPKA